MAAATAILLGGAQPRPKRPRAPRWGHRHDPSGYTVRCLQGRRTVLCLHSAPYRSASAAAHPGAFGHSGGSGDADPSGLAPPRYSMIRRIRNAWTPLLRRGLVRASERGPIAPLGARRESARLSDGTDGIDELLPFGVTARRGWRVLRCHVAVTVSSSEDRRTRPRASGSDGSALHVPSGTGREAPCDATQSDA